MKTEIYRKFRPGTQYMLANLIGIKESTLSRIVMNRIDPTPKEATALSKLLGVPPDELFADDDDTPDVKQPSRR